MMLCHSHNCKQQASFYCSCDTILTYLCVDHLQTHLESVITESSHLISPLINESNSSIYQEMTAKQLKGEIVQNSLSKTKRIQVKLANSITSIDKDIQNLQVILEEIKATNKLPKRAGKLPMFDDFKHSELLSLQNLMALKKNQRILDISNHRSQFTKKWNQTRFCISQEYKTSKSLNINKWIAKKIIQDIPSLTSLSALEQSYFNIINLVKKIKVSEYVTRYLPRTSYEALLEIAIFSRLSDKVITASSNAITILNRANFSFKNRDLSYIKLKEADLSGAYWYKVNFTGAIFENCNFSQSNFYYCNFENCDLTTTQFGQLPPLINDYVISTIAWFPSGEFLASASYDSQYYRTSENKIKIWRIDTQRKVKALRGHQDKITSLQVSKDGKFLVSGSEDRTLIIWDLATYTIIKELTEFYHMSITISPCGSYISSGSQNETFVVFNIHTFEQFTFSTQQDLVSSVAFSPCGNVLTCACDLWIKFFDLNTRSLSKEFNNYNKNIYDLNYSPDGRYIVFSSHMDRIKVLNVKTLEVIIKLFWNNTWFFSVSFSMCGNFIAFRGHDWSAKICSIQKQRQVKHFDGHLDEVAAIKFSPKTNLLASGSTDKSIKLWCSSIEETSRDFKELYYPVFLVKLLPGPNLFISIDKTNRVVKTWDLSQLLNEFENPQLLDEQAALETSYIHSKSGIPDLNLWITNVNLIIALNARKLAPSKMQISPNYKYLTMANNRIIKIWIIENLQEAITLNYNKTSFAFSHCGNKFAVVYRDYQIEIHDLSTQITDIKDFKFKIIALTFSHCGKYLAVSTDKFIIVIIELDSYRKIKEIPGHRSEIYKLRFSHDSRFLLSITVDNIINIWNVETKNRIANLYGHRQQINAVTFSRCDNYIISCSRDTSIKVWNISSIVRLGMNKPYLEWSSMSSSLVVYNCELKKAKLSDSDKEVLDYYSKESKST